MAVDNMQWWVRDLTLRGAAWTCRERGGVKLTKAKYKNKKKRWGAERAPPHHPGSTSDINGKVISLRNNVHRTNIPMGNALNQCY